MMNLLFVNRNAGLGGGTTYLRSLIPSLRHIGHQCEVMLRRGAASGDLEATIGKTWWLPLLGKIANARIQHLIKQENIDVVIPQNRTCARQCLQACQATGTPMVMTLHNIVDLSASLDATAYASAIVVMNGNNAAYLRETYPALADKVSVTHLPFAKELYGEVGPPVPRQDGPVKILYLGRLSRTKGELGLRVADAVGELSAAGEAVHLTVCGGGSRLQEMRRRGELLNQRFGREILRAPGGSRHPAMFIGDADIVVGAGYCAIEGIALEREVVAIGFEGLYGAVNAENIAEATAANFGDTGARQAKPTAADIAKELRAALGALGTDRTWAEQYVAENFAAERVAQNFADIVSEAIS